MLSIQKGTTAQYLADIDRITGQMRRVQGQVSSGIRIGQASDDPGAAAQVIGIQAMLAQNQQLRSNLGNIKAELDTADSSMQTAVKVVENAVSLAAQGVGN